VRIFFSCGAYFFLGSQSSQYRIFAQLFLKLMSNAQNIDWSLIPLNWQASHVVDAVRSGASFSGCPYTRAELETRPKTTILDERISVPLRPPTVEGFSFQSMENCEDDGRLDMGPPGGLPFAKANDVNKEIKRDIKREADEKRIITVIDKMRQCPKCQGWEFDSLRRVCAVCKIVPSFSAVEFSCEARILSWNEDEPDVMLCTSFCPSTFAGCTAALRLWRLMKDGSMSYFYTKDKATSREILVEEDTWRDDLSTSATPSDNVFRNWTCYKQKWPELAPEIITRKSHLRWKM
jgi:hypothetical protein